MAGADNDVVVRVCDHSFKVDQEASSKMVLRGRCRCGTWAYKKRIRRGVWGAWVAYKGERGEDRVAQILNAREAREREAHWLEQHETEFDPLLDGHMQRRALPGAE